MKSWLLTWNAYRWHWDNYEEECEGLSEDYPSVTWSCQSKKVQIGDEFFLIKLGKPPRGIIGHGIITDDVFEGEHWDEGKTGKPIYYVTGEWDTLLNYKTQEILDVAVLDAKCKQQWWHPQGSGKRINDDVLPTLYELWAKVTKDYPANTEESIYYESGGIVEGTKNPSTQRDMNATPKLDEFS